MLLLRVWDFLFFLPLQNPKLARVLRRSPSRAFTQIAANGMGFPLRSANERSLAFGVESSTTSNNKASLLTTLLYLSKVYRFNDTRLVLNHKLLPPSYLSSPPFQKQSHERYCNSIKKLRLSHPPRLHSQTNTMYSACLHVD